MNANLFITAQAKAGQPKSKRLSQEMFPGKY
jgi:hypothetical protein